MSLFEFLLFIHLLGAAAWFGGALVMQLRAERALRNWDPAELQAVASEGEWLGSKFFGAAAGVVVVTGIWMVIESGWEFSDPFVMAGITGFLLSSIVGAAFLGPESGRLKELIATKGLEHPEAKRRISRINRISRVDLTTIGIVIFFMATKPWS